MRFGLSMIAISVAALLGAPAAAIEIDPNNPPPWPARHIAQTDMPSRFDRAPVEDLLAAKDAGNHEAGVVLWRRQRAKDEALLAWARAGAARNDTRAMVILGQMLSSSDRAEAIRLYRAAADLGDTEAMRNLASAHLAGEGVEKNPSEAVRLYTAAAERGDSSAIVTLINIYSNGSAGLRDPQAAARWEAVRREKGVEIITTPPPPAVAAPPPVDKAPLLQAARAGDAVAMRRLAIAYAADFADEAAPAEAYRWYKAAAETGDASAMFGLGTAYRYGRGVKKDAAKGAEWLLKAAKAGNRTAMYNLSEMYRRGEGVKADAAQAQYWMYQWFWSPDLPADDAVVTRVSSTSTSPAAQGEVVEAPTRITSPQWVRRPSKQQIDREFPDRALRLEKDGLAKIDCTITDEGRLTGCRVISESPEDLGFGTAALRLSRLYEHRPAIDGVPVASSKVTVEIPFRME